MSVAPLRLPYPGLRSFRREESDLFFGREDCINAMVDRLAATRFLAVLGSSGTGKSSVVKTGLLDALDLGLMASAGSTWRIVDFRPGGAPLNNLALRLLETEHDGPTGVGKASDQDAALLRAFLLRGPRAVVEWCSEGHLPATGNLLLLVDQFEELFRYQDYAGREEAEAFCALLIESARQRQVPIHVALTMRSEYLGACALVDGLAEAISGGMVLIPRMTREQCRSAIVGPAAICGFKIEDALVNRLLNDLAAFAPWDDRSARDQLDRLARRADQLPMLQYCLNRIWMRARDAAFTAPIVLTLVDYDRIGGLAGALDAHADEVLHTLADQRRPATETIFRALTAGSSASDAVRRPTRFGELVEICGGDETGVRNVVDAFRAPGCNFLAPELDPQKPKPLSADAVVDISHESLIRQWKRLSTWVEAEARSRRQWQRLLDRFEDGQPLSGAELANTLAWRAEEKPNAVWARRYGGDFAAMMNFIESSKENSERERRRLAPLFMPLFCLAAVAVCVTFTLGIVFSLARLKGITGTPTIPWYTAPDAAAVSITATCVFGLWRYAQIGKRWAAAGLAILAWQLLGIASLATFIPQQQQQIGLLCWNVVFAAPGIVSIMAAFYGGFRNIYTWLLLISVFAAPIGIVGLDPSVEGTMKGVLYIVILCGWCVVFGFRLRGSHGSAASRRGRKRFFALKFAVLTLLASEATSAGARVTLQLAYGAKSPAWWWLVQFGVLALLLAAIVCCGLQTCRGLRPKSLLAAAAAVSALQFASGTALVAALLSHNVALPEAENWAIAVLTAPCMLTVLAIFDPAFRNVVAWPLLMLSFICPAAILAWTYDRQLVPISQQTCDFILELIAVLWIAAVGYRMQTASHFIASPAEPSAGETDRPSLTSEAKGAALPQAAI